MVEGPAEGPAHGLAGTPAPPRLLMVAGEASGDLHGGALLSALRRRLPDAQVRGVGGERMRAAGLDQLADVRSLSAAGLVEIMGSVGRHHRVMEQLKRQMDQHRPDAVVLIDYPGFNLLVAGQAHRRGIPVFFYIAPQVWAWGKGRARRMGRIIDRLAVIFPFEEALFNSHGRAFARYVGHPLMDQLQVTQGREDTLRRHGLAADQRLLLLLPGSRRAEIRMLLPDLLKAAAAFAQDGWQVALLRAPTVDRAFLEEVAGPLPVPCLDGDTCNLLHAADAALVCSGTATLQAALLGCPHVIAYRFSWLTYLLARIVTRHRVLGLPNVILGRVLFPELLQRAVTPTNLVRALRELLADPARWQQGVEELRSRMGPPGASLRAADELVDLLR
ncbi:lipid-A-disaccharide synthase [Cyanobium sp. PCC 7001]|uniref:lipid-A-disaccharide synthase n=1 Tax=Cyanobium sp. PCC 7001 TaxID=180281 RepID=UPI0002FDA596|nr:lipid-A-disaccharide synthase [Cyanobium sp. PCC 7001]